MELDVNPKTTSVPASVELPAPTAWPVVLAFGLALLFAGLLTSITVSALGAILAVAGCVGWFRQVLPHEQHETVPVVTEVVPIVTERREVVRIEIVPETAPGSAPHRDLSHLGRDQGRASGKRGHGGARRRFTAFLRMAVSGTQSTCWQQWCMPSRSCSRSQHLTSFHPELLLVATALHLVTSMLVGLLYGVMLPMFPRRPILLGGFIAPLMWSGLLYTSLGIINPLLNQRIDWTWFVASQIGFGIVAGLVVVRQERVRTRQHMPFAVLAGIEAPGIMDEKHERSDQR